MRKRDRFRRALLIIGVAAVAAVMFSVCEGEGSAATHANLRVCPVGRLCKEVLELIGKLTESKKKDVQLLSR